MEIDEKEVEALTEKYVRNWIIALRNEGKKPSPEGLKRYRALSRRLAIVKLSFTKMREELEKTNSFRDGVKEPK